MQRFCSAQACRKASKARSNALWRQKNPGYDRGPEQVARVQRWRAGHPGYSQGKRGKKPVAALQDLDPRQVTADQLLVKVEPGAASDFVPCEPPTSSCNGAPGAPGALALQESFGPVARNLVEQGRCALAQHPDLFGLQGASKNTQLDLC
jgi:hypothetical protein